MRIISQCGTMDLPYELIAFSTGYNGNKSENYIFVHSTIFGTDKGTIVARYSTEEKARKVMGMVQKEYLCYMTNNVGTAFIQPKVFKFPNDDEI